MSKKVAFFIILGSILIISGVIYAAANSPYSPFRQALREALPFLSLLPKKDVSTQTEEPISSPVPVEIRTIQGIISKVSPDKLTIKTKNGGVEIFQITKTFDFQRVVSGTLSGGDIKTSVATFSDLKVDQEVLVIAEKDGNYARSVYILR